eukprot:CAMPEP_0196781816 /NCGR_PEP_ID=MMETSP1104-20130614/10385_1 /TAXON_ID=33652 /ORGANISM="Cafeteria sp., Strain Caron Lab Isolate" /LENGTH=348 /DNA_ID=CAMNT_0042152047 /DNA_START=60 /DNA_END=1106 /DNA_ORIENTATION=+
MSHDEGFAMGAGIGAEDEEDERVTLNIGGTLFETWRSTLTRRSSMLSAMFGECLSMAKPDGRGHFFFDRDATHFRVILNYLRTNRLVLPTEKRELQELLLEAEYFAVDEIRDACQRTLGGLRFEETFTSFSLDSGAWREAPLQTLTSFDLGYKTVYAGLPEVLRVENVSDSPALRLTSRLNVSERRAMCTTEMFDAATQRCEVTFKVMPYHHPDMGSMYNVEGVFELYLWNPTSGEYIGMFLYGNELGARRELYIVCYEGGHKKEKPVSEAWDYGQELRFTIQSFGDKTEVRINAIKKKTFHVPVALSRIAPFHVVLGQRMGPADKRPKNDTAMHYADVAVRRIAVFG